MGYRVHRGSQKQSMSGNFNQIEKIGDNGISKYELCSNKLLQKEQWTYSVEWLDVINVVTYSLWQSISHRGRFFLQERIGERKTIKMYKFRRCTWMEERKKEYGKNKVSEDDVQMDSTRI